MTKKEAEKAGYAAYSSERDPRKEFIKWYANRTTTLDEACAWNTWLVGWGRAVIEDTSQRVHRELRRRILW